MGTGKARLGLLAALLAVLAVPGQAGANDYYVPPGNSAATQYTEALPTAGGHRDAEKNQKKSSPTPAKTLGSADARKLDSYGDVGREAAEFAAATAPTEEATPPSEPKETGDRQGDKRETPSPREQEAAGSLPGSGPDGPSGSSGFAEVLSTAIGSSSGGLGMLLPLAFFGAAAWALAFFLRQRNRPTP